MSLPARQSFSRPNGDISLLEWPNNSGPALYFAHATGFNAQTYLPLLTPLAANMRVIAADARGHGFTTLPTGPDMAKGWEVYREDLAALLDATAPGPLYLAGHSMGAVTCAMFAARWPERVKGLILLEPVLIPWIARLILLLPGGLNSAMSNRAEKRRDHFPSFEAARDSYRGRGAFRTWPEDFLTAYLEGGLLPTGQGTEMRLACAPAWEAQTFRSAPFGAARLADKIRCPVTLIYAEHSTPPESECRAFARAHGNTRLLKIPQTTHFLPMERPDLVREEIIRMVAG
ncbi:MAG TPA: alpha/beta hydrolase [Rhizomicrobium sp.]|nr:alpha/beta hydrolase [Rhizomicrobium sp.]